MSRSIALPGSWINQQIRICGIEDWFEILIAPFSTGIISKPSSSLIKNSSGPVHVENPAPQHCIKTCADAVVPTAFHAVKPGATTKGRQVVGTLVPANHASHTNHLSTEKPTLAHHARVYPMNEPTYCRDTGRRIGVCACPKCLPVPPTEQKQCVPHRRSRSSSQRETLILSPHTSQSGLGRIHIEIACRPVFRVIQCLLASLPGTVKSVESNFMLITRQLSINIHPKNKVSTNINPISKSNRNTLVPIGVCNTTFMLFKRHNSSLFRTNTGNPTLPQIHPSRQREVSPCALTPSTKQFSNLPAAFVQPEPFERHANLLQANVLRWNPAHCTAHQWI